MVAEAPDAVATDQQTTPEGKQKEMKMSALAARSDDAELAHQIHKLWNEFDAFMADGRAKAEAMRRSRILVRLRLEHPSIDPR
jgi:hypothetical protein